MDGNCTLVQCNQGHARVWPAPACLICAVDAELFRRGIRARPCEHLQRVNQSHFAFKCSGKHRFVTDGNVSRCPVCALMSRMTSAHKSKCIAVLKPSTHVNAKSLMKFRCEKYVHAHGCPELADSPMCKCQPVPCGCEFIARPCMINPSADVLNCATVHMWLRDHGIPNSIRIMEMLYGVTFMCYTQAAQFTGYNRKLGIAFIHEVDAVAQPGIVAARQYCSKLARPILLLVIPRELQNASDLCRFFIYRLHDCVVAPRWTANDEAKTAIAHATRGMCRQRARDERARILTSEFYYEYCQRTRLMASPGAQKRAQRMPCV